MIFCSEIFLFLFLPFVLFTYFGLLFWSRKLQNLFLLVMSLVFYAYGEPWFVFVMMLSILCNWGFGLLVDRFRNRPHIVKTILVAMLGVNLGILGYFKYWMFTLGNIQYFTGSYIPIPQITLPIGISFFTFQAISYVIDVYRKGGNPESPVKAQKNPFNVGLYIAFFPQLIAGPIVRYETIAEQILNRKETLDDFANGVCRFIVGMGKKVLIANSMAFVADAAFSSVATGELTVVWAWMGAIAYTLQIYFDFSGYSDMAIGLGRMFGFHFLENFNYPYVATSISEFWRRWHISLGSFFRDYVYIPLGGNRVSTLRLMLNLSVVWFLTGLWHGADWAFVLWGLMFFVFLVFEKFTHFEKRGNSPLFRPMKHVYTMLIVVVGWVLFRCGIEAIGVSTADSFRSLAQTSTYLSTMFGFADAPFFSPETAFYWNETRYFYLFGILFSFPLIPRLIIYAESLRHPVLRYAYSVMYVLFYAILIVISMACVIKSGYNPFIYFNF